MEIRKLKKEELYEAFEIAAYCFHMRLDDPEQERENVESDTNDSWGAFDENGRMMAKIINNRYTFYIDGQGVKTGGIGGVSTLPEYRDRGAVREIFKELLRDAYRNGEVISTLYPFNHEFYRKAGYETVTYLNEYTFSAPVLRPYRFGGEVCKWNTGDPVTDFLTVYNVFAPGYNLMMARSEEDMLEHMKVKKEYMDRKFSYVLKQGGKPVAYVIFTDIRHDPAPILKVEECAWTGRDGFYAILGFLARFTADYGEIKLPLPVGIDLLRLIQSPLAYDVQKYTGQSFMVRAVNAKKLLETIKKPAGCDFTVKVSDEIIEENNRIFRVKSDSVEELKDPSADDFIMASADIELSGRALGQMAVGAVNFDEALLRRDVTVNGSEDILRRVFVEKKIYVGEHF